MFNRFKAATHSNATPEIRGSGAAHGRVRFPAFGSSIPIPNRAMTQILQAARVLIGVIDTDDHVAEYCAPEVCALRKAIAEREDLEREVGEISAYFGA